MKKVIALAVISAMIFTAFCGCGQGSGSGASSVTGDGGATAANAGKTNEYGWKLPSKTMVINYYGGQESPDDCKKYTTAMKDYLLKNFNVSLNKTVYDVDMNEKLNLMLSSGDYPECIVGMDWNTAQKWKDQGKALDLTSLVDKYGPNIKAKMGDYYKRYLDESGKLYWLAYLWGVGNCVDYAPQIRWDWYQEIGSPDISTPEKYYNALKAITAKHPTNSQGKKTYALGLWKVTTINNSFTNTFGGMWGLKHGWKVNADNSVTHWLDTNEGIEMAKYVNQFYRDGLFDPDSFTMTLDEWGAKASAERYTGFVGSWWVTGTYGNEVWKKKLGSSFNDNMRFVHVDVTAPGVKQSTFGPVNGFGSAVILTDKCKNPEDYIKWFNFENTDLGANLVGWGIPNDTGSVWTLNKDGKWAVKDSVKKTLTENEATFNYDAEQKEGGECEMAMTPGCAPRDGGYDIWINQSFKDKWKVRKDTTLKNDLFDFTSFLSISIPSDDPLADINQQVGDIANNAWAKAITARTSDECAQIITDARAAAQKAGIGKLEQFYSDNYKKNVTKYGK